MAVHTFMLALAASSAALAMWVALRFPSVAPARMSALAGWLVAAGLLPLFVSPMFDLVGNHAGAFAAVFLVALPGCTFLFLVGAWVMLFVHRLIAPYLH
jgi:hypothetical protein